MEIVCISDTHNHIIDVPKCDMVLHAGDMTGRGSINEYQKFIEWYSLVDANHKIVIPGNHDFICQKEPELTQKIAADNGIHLLNCSGLELGGIKIYGYPWQPEFHNWAFNGTPNLLKLKAKEIPECDILISHGPPKGILDLLKHPNYGEDPHIGDKFLLERIKQIKPKLVVFGHVHEGYGILNQDGIYYVNASSCTLNYKPINPPVKVIFKF